MDDPVVAGITPTAGGVTFAGDLGGVLRVLDSRTGVLLHSVDTKGSMAGGLVTYQIGNTQYVAMASGNVSRVATRVTGIPSIVIMALEGSQKTAAATRGQALYMQVCSSCHGADGNLVADRKLGTLRQRRDSASTVAYIKDPKPPMPKLYPAILSEQDIQDVASYVLDSMQGE
jgi:alcohol dehydrogenase (cytochrome c)